MTPMSSYLIRFFSIWGLEAQLSTLQAYPGKTQRVASWGPVVIMLNRRWQDDSLYKTLQRDPEPVGSGFQLIEQHSKKRPEFDKDT